MRDERDRVLLGGRGFRKIARSTVRHDSWTMRQVRKAGMDSVVMEQGETAEQYARRLLETVITSDEMHTLLGCFLIPESVDDLDWTPELAIETGKEIARLHEPDDRVKVQTAVLSVVIPFLRSELANLRASRPSSDSAAVGETIAKELAPTGIPTAAGAA